MSRSSPGLRVVILHNTDFAAMGADEKCFSSYADVENAARAVERALASRGHRAERVGVDHPGVAEAIDAIAADPPDVVFNLCESLRGDARHEVVVPTLLELAGLAYTGSNAATLATALRKDRAKMILAGHGVAVPEGAVFSTVAAARAAKLAFPLIVKPTREDASVGISSASVVHDARALAEAVERVVVGLAQPALAERYVEGREVYASLIGNAPPDVLPMHEIDFQLPPELPRIVSYEGKWVPSSVEWAGTQVKRCELDEPVRARVVAAARASFAALECADYGRVDIRLAADGTPYVIDVNPNCDLGDGAGFARAAAYAGLDYPSLVERVCALALERHAAAPHKLKPKRPVADAVAIARGRKRRASVRARADRAP